MGMAVSNEEQIKRLARTRCCPRCDLDKTWGTAMCRSCRTLLPEHMRSTLESIPSRDPNVVLRALKAAASYFHLHFQSVRNFGGGKKR